MHQHYLKRYFNHFMPIAGKQPNYLGCIVLTKSLFLKILMRETLIRSQPATRLQICSDYIFCFQVIFQS